MSKHQAKITIPTKLNEMSLGQLVSLATTKDLSNKQRSEEENREYIEALMWLCNLTREQVERLQVETLDSIHKAAGQAFDSVSFDFANYIVNPKYLSKFACVPLSFSDIEQEKIDIDFREKDGYKKVKNLWRRQQYKKETKRKKENLKLALSGDLFEISENVGQEMAGVWLHFLDNVEAQIKAINPESYWRNWAFIAPVISAIAWRKDEPRTIQTAQSKTAQIDLGRLTYFSSVFLNINASIAIQIYAFFLSKRMPFLKDQYTAYFQKK